MKGKVQFTELQLLKLMKGDKQRSKSRVFLEQVEGNSNFILFCQILNSVLAPVRPEHFQHNQLVFYHYAWVANTDPIALTWDWKDAMKKTVTRQVKALGVCSKSTCLDPYLVHLYCHFQKMDKEQREEPKKRKTLEQSVPDSEIKTEEEKEMKGESPNAAWIGEASGSKPLDTKMKVNFNEWRVLFQNLGQETSKLFEAFP
ncbi:hypothetical protein R1flu_008590 [Riccia fluitans]|uniref:Uncharacterized protein n=1 Tax=Riccia fluitans TaxID=41844 RepID=A0ABD1YCD0_9MARC